MNIWQQLKRTLLIQDRFVKQSIINLLSNSRYFGQIGNGIGGQISQYAFAKILNLGLTPQQQLNSRYLHCGKWWGDYYKLFPNVPQSADIIFVQTSNINYPPDKNIFNHIEYIKNIAGVSLKASLKQTNSIKSIHTNFKAYNASSAYSKMTFGKTFQWFNNSIQIFTDPQFHDDYNFPWGWRSPTYKKYQDVLINDIQMQIKKRLSTDPIKVQFCQDRVFIFQIPVKQLWKQVTINTLIPNNKFKVQQGRFNITNKNADVVFMVYGDRIMIGQGLDKQKIKRDSVCIELPKYEPEKFEQKLDRLICDF